MLILRNRNFFLKLLETLGIENSGIKYSHTDSYISQHIVKTIVLFVISEALTILKDIEKPLKR